MEEGEDDWQQVQGRTKEPFRDLRKAFFPNGLDKVEQVDLLKKRGEVIAARGKKVRACVRACVYSVCTCTGHTGVCARQHLPTYMYVRMYVHKYD